VFLASIARRRGAEKWPLDVKEACKQPNLTAYSVPLINTIASMPNTPLFPIFVAAPVLGIELVKHTPAPVSSVRNNRLEPVDLASTAPSTKPVEPTRVSGSLVLYDGFGSTTSGLFGVDTLTQNLYAINPSTGPVPKVVSDPCSP
jgi:hypothetical protein